MPDKKDVNEFISDISPLEAVENAIKESLWKQTETRIMNALAFPEKGVPKRLREALKEGSEGLCNFGSRDVIHYLTTKHKDLFLKMLVISTEVIDYVSALNEVRPQIFHSYFLVQDNDGVWYAGSPANHEHFKDKDYALTIIRDNSLDALIRKMEARDLATYPQAKDIENNSINTVAFPVGVNDLVNMFELRYTNNGILPMTYKYSP